MASKYITVSISGIILSVSKTTEINGYTESVISCTLPDDGLSSKEERNWIAQNNYRMTKICQFMNENNL